MMTSPESGSYASGPLSGLRVLDLSWLLPGPLCTGILADLGAEVVKIERPGDGDYARTMLPGLFQLVNRGKRSAVVDLRTPQGRETVLKLAERADVFVEGFRPGVMARLAVGYEHIRARHQGIVYVSLSGYGQTGPAANEPGHDVNYCGRAGLLHVWTRRLWSWREEFGTEAQWARLAGRALISGGDAGFWPMMTGETMTLSEMAKET